MLKERDVSKVYIDLFFATVTKLGFRNFLNILTNENSLDVKSVLTQVPLSCTKLKYCVCFTDVAKANLKESKRR